MPSVEIRNDYTGLYTLLTYTVSPNIAANTSSVRVTKIEVRNTDSSAYQAWLRGNIKIDGYTAVTMVYNNTQGCGIDFSTSYSGVGDSGSDGGYLSNGWSSTNVTVAHNADGSKNVTFSVDIEVIRRPQGTVYYRSDTSQSVAIDSIPRVASVVASSVALGTAMPISISKASPNLYVTVTYSCGSASGTIASNTYDTTLYWTPPISLASQSINSPSVTVTITVYTYSGGVYMGASAASVACPIPASVIPTLSFTVSDERSALTSYTGYIQNQSKARVVTTANGVYGSTIRKVEVFCGRLSSAGFNTAIDLPNSGDITVSVTVTDSRGRIATLSKVIYVVPYELPTGNIYQLYRCSSTGVNQPDGAYAKILFTGNITALSNMNTAEYAIGMRVRGGSSWTAITKVPSLNGKYQASGELIIAANVENAYEFAVLATDAFGTRESMYAGIPVSYALLDFNKSNKAVGIGQRASTKDTLSIGMNIKMFGNRVSDIGNATESGDAISLGVLSWYMQTLYPIGAVYSSKVNDCAPSKIVGGSWNQIQGAPIYMWERTG